MTLVYFLNWMDAKNSLSVTLEYCWSSLFGNKFMSSLMIWKGEKNTLIARISKGQKLQEPREILENYKIDQKINKKLQLQSPYKRKWEDLREGLGEKMRQSCMLGNTRLVGCCSDINDYNAMDSSALMDSSGAIVFKHRCFDEHVKNLSCITQSLQVFPLS